MSARVRIYSLWRWPLLPEWIRSRLYWRWAAQRWSATSSDAAERYAEGINAYFRSR